MGPGRLESGASRIGSLSPELRQHDRHKPLQHNALCRRSSAGFIGDNLRVGWVRYGLDSVRGPDANADCGVMGGDRERRWERHASSFRLSIRWRWTSAFSLFSLDPKLIAEKRTFNQTESAIAVSLRRAAKTAQKTHPNGCGICFETSEPF
jgi:hypothetical protein